MTRASMLPIVVCLCLGAAVVPARAQPSSEPVVVPPPPSAASDEPPPYKLGAYAETFYQWNFNRPWNGVTNYRGFDNRHNSFTVANVALDAQWDYEDVLGRLTLQIGHTPSTYYMAEPRFEATGGASATGAELWKYLQQAYAGYRFFDALSIAAGIFLSPIGPEAMAIKDNWNWSRSNLFFGLPFYHTGARASYSLSSWTLSVAAYNGWNSVVDNNRQKSLAIQAVYSNDALTLAMLYFGGGERPVAAPEGNPWRHLFDVHATWNASEWLSIIAHANAGFEPNQRGVSRWVAAALFTRLRALSWLFVALRGDVFVEHVPSDRLGAAAPLFWPAPWVSSATATLDFRPHPRVSFRLEYRHDHAGEVMFYGSQRVPGEPNAPALPNERWQDTVTMGATTWF